MAGAPHGDGFRSYPGSQTDWVLYQSATVDASHLLGVESPLVQCMTLQDLDHFDGPLERT